MGKFLKSTFDWIVIFAGCVLLILSLRGIEDNCLKWCIYIAAGLAVVYAGYAFILFFFKRPQFDWHLINGHFLLKTCCLILLMPFLLTVLSGRFFVDSPKELVYESNLYECKDNKLPCKIKHKQESPNLFWSTYYHFVDPGNQHMTTSQSGREWAALIAILGVFLLNGLLVSSIVGWIDSRKEKWIKGAVRYKWFLKLRDHYVIIGGNDVVVGIVKQLFEQAKTARTLLHPYILIQTSRDVESFRRELFSTLTEWQQQHIIIYYGSRISEIDIKDLCVGSAKEVYVLGEDTRTDDIESYHDTMNMKCLELISKNIQDVHKLNIDNKLTCRVMFEYQTSFNILQVTDIDSEKIEFIPFNYYEMWAQNVLICQELEDKSKCVYLPLEGFEGIKSTDNKFVHLVVVGMSRMGLAMAIEAAHLAHFPNFETNKKRTRITFIDATMEQEKHFFMGRFKEMFSVARYRDVTNATYGLYHDFESYPWLNPLEDTACESPYMGDYLGKDVVDIEWEFINGSIENPNIQQYLTDAATNPDAKLTIAICLPENSRAIAAAAYMPDAVYASQSTLQVLVYQRLNNDLLSQINQNNSRYLKKLKAFGMSSMCYNSYLVEISDAIAREIDAAYNQYNWDKMKLRYDGTGLIDEDYDWLIGNLYRTNIEKKEQIKEDCITWMNENSSKEFSRVKTNLKEFKKQMKDKYPNQSEKGEPMDKPKSAKMWSNQYNIYSMWTKFRCMTIKDGGSFIPKPDDFEKSLNVLGKMEHNRWVVEQLLLRYRPLSKQEQKEAQILDLYSSSTQKRAYKKDFAHLDICSNEKLNEIDYKMAELDQALVKVLPKAYNDYLNRRKMTVQQ